VAYLIDSDVFIQAKDRHYGFDFCPAFWDWISAANAAGLLFSVEQVRDELAGHEDDLKTWAEARDDRFFLKATTPLVQRLGDVSAWVMDNGFEEAAINIFLDAADYFLIAHALAGGHTVVTHEVAANTVKKVKIPNVCIGLDIRCINPFTMLRNERARFVLPGEVAEPTLFERDGGD